MADDTGWLRWLGVVRGGFSTDRHYPLERYEEHVAATGLLPEARFATWDSEPWEPGRAYAVSVHRSEKGRRRP